MNDKIKVIGSIVSQEMVVGLGKSFEQFGNAMGSQMSSLKDVQGGYQRCGKYGAGCGE